MKKILIIDDNRNLVDMVLVMFKKEGYEVVCAYNGEEGLSKARGEKPDLIILDVMLPKLDGYEVCRQLKADKNYKNIPIILLTVKASAENVKTAREVKADFYIVKPYDPDNLLAKVKEFLNKP